MTQINVVSLKEKLGQVTLFDLRPRHQFNKDSLPSAEHLSLEAAKRGELPHVDWATPIYLICERGQISELAGLYLEAAGFENVFNVEGGMIAWHKMMQADQE